MFSDIQPYQNAIQAQPPLSFLLHLKYLSIKKEPLQLTSILAPSALATISPSMLVSTCHNATNMMDDVGK